MYSTEIDLMDTATQRSVELKTGIIIIQREGRIHRRRKQEWNAHQGLSVYAIDLDEKQCVYCSGAVRRDEGEVE